ncbi:YcaO-like family protein [Haloarculaceae archaeon H-GB2-1]|nr:YcaO-like family protein [Haloarculaceae archaeon H-GB1-1]MEA5385953.1 YcaO-like family protein [Haloarculaceae archaeon H-GB11]MEA5407459.1 YcaO-like family protein [Haloarculaceae archaeon H-GB2-1]
MTVALAGSGPALEAVRVALADVDESVRTTEADEIDDADLAVVVARTGSETFSVANRTARASDTPWLAVELGGVGGVPVVDASVAGFGPGTGCYACLERRVAANVESDAAPTAAPAAPIARFAGALAGRRVVAFLQEEAPIFGSVVEVPHAERRFLPVPNCECDSADGVALADEDDDRSLEDALARAERGLDPRVGLLREVGEAESYPAPYYLATVSDTSGFSDATAARNAAGVDADWNAAFMKALGEGLERYCAGVYRLDSYPADPVTERADAVPPAEFVTMSDGDDESEPIHWADAESMATGETVSVPASFVHYPPQHRRWRPAITTGLGLGNSRAQARLSGLYEVVERDAAMLAWYSTYEPLELVVEDETYDALRRRAGAEGLDATALLLTQDVDVPVVAVAVHRETFPKFALGSAANLDPVAAARSALAEAIQNWVELDGMGPDGATEASGDIGLYANDPEIAWDHLGAESRIPADSVGPAPRPTVRAELDAVVSRVVDADLRPLAARTTTRDVAALGFEAVRVLVPSAQPLFFDSPYFGERAQTVPEAMGYEPKPGRRHHPFP